jgi:hypothetical protein
MKNDAEQFLPLGQAKPKPAPEAKPEWTATNTVGVEVDRDGKLRTSIPENELASGIPCPFVFSTAAR